MKYYLQIVKDNVSILVDSDIGYYHQFKIDDIIEVVMSDDLGVSLNIHGWIIQNPRFTIDWDKKDYQQFTIVSAVVNGYMIDITKGVERNKKLDELGI
jgi:aryl-phospho-beta-D-glucosidase BglC (GH1 family)